MIKLMLVDDHELMRIGMEHLLAGRENIEVVAQAGSGEEALEIAQKIMIDVVLMDINMPGMGGIEATREFVKLYGDKIKILIVTVFEDEPFASRLLQIGASGYLTKGCNISELLKAIHEVMAGKNYINVQIVERLALQHKNSHQAADSLLENLSEHELEILKSLAAGKQMPEIAKNLGINNKLACIQRHQLLKKLALNNDVELIYFAIRHGLVSIEHIMQKQL